MNYIFHVKKIQSQVIKCIYNISVINGILKNYSIIIIIYKNNYYYKKDNYYNRGGNYYYGYDNHYLDLNSTKKFFKNI